METKNTIPKRPDKTLSPSELSSAIRKEREWLEKYNGVSAVTGGPVEDMEGVPLPSDSFQGTPALSHSQAPEVNPEEPLKKQDPPSSGGYLVSEVLGDEGGGGISSGGQPGSTSGGLRPKAKP